MNQIPTDITPASDKQLDQNTPEFRLTRLILIDSYARGKTVEIDLAGHTALTGENASGKTTLLRLFPLFFGEAPSRVIQSDENNLKFARHYLPHTSSYVVFEYERRGQRVLSVIHADGQSDGANYRFINRPFSPELFRDTNGLVQSQDLSRHLTKLGVDFTKPLSLTLYRQILQNEAGREHRQLATMYSFTGSGGRLKHIERIITSILQRATTFFDLKRMIVSSIQENTDAFSMRTSKRELTHWIGEYEAHNAVMEKAPIMEELEQHDQHRRQAVDEFAVLHARFELMRDHYLAQVVAGEAEEERLRNLRTQQVSDFNARSLTLQTAVTAEQAKINGATSTLSALDRRKLQFDADKADDRALAVDALPETETRVKAQRARLQELEASSKSVVEVFDKMDAGARKDADDDTRQLEARKSGLVQDFSNRQAAIYSRHAENQRQVSDRQRTELAGLNSNVANLGADVAKLEVEARNPQPDPECQQAYDLEFEAGQEAMRRIDELRGSLEPLERKLSRAQQQVIDEEAMMNGSQQALEKAEGELQDVIDAGNAGEETLLGFLRAHKQDWAQNVGRTVSEKTRLRTDLSPALTGGDDLFGVSIDLDQLDATRLASEESIQQEIARLRQLVQKRQRQHDEDKAKLAEASRQRQLAKDARDAHQTQLNQAISAKGGADQRLTTARARLQASKETARRAAVAALESCRSNLSAARASLADTETRHASELRDLEKANAKELAGLKQAHDTEVGSIDGAIQGIATRLKERLAEIATQRNEALRANGVDVSVLDPIRTDIQLLDQRIDQANKDRRYVAEYRDWLAVSWTQRQQHVDNQATAKAAKQKLEETHRDLVNERDARLKEHDRIAKEVTDAIDKAEKSRREAYGQMSNLVSWPKDKATFEAGFDDRVSLELLTARRRQLQQEYAELLKRIHEGVDDIRKQMMSTPGTGPERYHATAQQRIGYPPPGQEYLWIEGLRGWYQHEHAQNKATLIQLGKTFAQNISAFWSGLGNFKKQVGNFASDLKSHLHQGQVFANIADVSVIITTDVDKQNYWQAIENLHHEYDSWHTQGDALPPASFISAARDVAMVLSDDKGLVADPVDLINLQVTANIDGDGSKVAKNEASLARMSSNGLSYIILVVILIGFINRIRRKERVVVPFVVDELKDLSVGNATALLNLLARNNITLVSAFPDVDPDLAPLFTKNYKILPGRTLATVKLEHEEHANV
ncbi:MAG: ATP-binding protein [Zoogloea sp.]|uniref:ATP-binding protein n=1 Tax=Zoogloea sp. TaxID=49181 RepID=UPI0026318304|nr:ATP-binding protein [Zoogloea sp.]MDD2991843.1 ATP-binding protein [Zoogloea sp.]